MDGRIASKAPIAQLDRASVFGTEGWGFKSLWAHHGGQVVTDKYKLLRTY
jgi:hypothetical protein